MPDPEPSLASVTTQQKIGEAFMLAELPLMTTAATGVAQAIAQLPFDFPDWVPLAIVIGFALLITFYVARYIRKARFGECVVVIPLATFLVFAAAVAANNVTVGPRDQLSKLEEAVRNKERIVQVQDQKIAILRQQLGLPLQTDAPPAPPAAPAEPAPRSSIERIADFLAPRAYAQPRPEAPARAAPATKPAAQQSVDPKAQEALRALERELRLLETQDKRLQTEMKKERPLWKKF